ncbi:MAG: polysaccharide biosynthesis/export family protein [Opitutae bacterium]|nr:polysaccharide biosynthesis/export family protein [Opitutae bacterium]
MKLLPRLLLLVLLGAVRVFGAEADAIADAKKAYIPKLLLGDRIRVAVYQEDDLTAVVRIDARGQINLPLIGAVTVGELTRVEAQNLIQAAYREGRFLRSPQVTVSIEEYAPREVSIQGQIRNPGRWQLPPESTFTLVELVTKAGGITDIGKGSAVSITRILPDGTKKVFVIDVDSMIKGKRGSGKTEDNIFLLQPGDIVYIPERLI